MSGNGGREFRGALTRLHHHNMNHACTHKENVITFLYYSHVKEVHYLKPQYIKVSDLLCLKKYFKPMTQWQVNWNACHSHSATCWPGTGLRRFAVLPWTLQEKNTLSSPFRQERRHLLKTEVLMLACEVFSLGVKGCWAHNQTRLTVFEFHNFHYVVTETTPSLPPSPPNVLLVILHFVAKLV